MHVAFALAFLAGAVALAVLGARGTLARPAARGCCSCCLRGRGARSSSPPARGIVVPTQVVFVPMLLLLPMPLVPLLVAAALVLADIGAGVRGRLGPGADRARRPRTPGSPVAPAVVLVLAGAQTPDWDDVAVVRRRARGAARRRRAHQRCARVPLALGVRPRELRHELALVCARRRAAGARRPARRVRRRRRSPTPSSLRAPARRRSSPLFAREREARIDGALELSQAYRGTALLLGDVIEADDQYTGDHTKDVVELTLQVADALRRRRRDPPRRRVRRAAARRRQDPHPERDHQQARAARRRRVGDHEDPHGRGPADARARRRRARPRRRRRARLARALGRRRLPRRAAPARRSRSPRGSCRPATPTTR